MLFNSVMIDMFNLIYHNLGSNETETSNKVVDFITKEVEPRLEKDGTIYLLFDPIPENDLGISKNFKFLTARQEIAKSYKANRHKNPIAFKAAITLKKFYAFRGKKYLTYCGTNIEADDFVESLLRDNDTGTTALITNDSDWCRYLSDNVTMYKCHFELPYTKDDFYAEKGIPPTVASVTMHKAIYGDDSDNVKSILKIKKVKYSGDFNFIIKSFLLYIAKENITLEGIKKAFNTYTLSELFNSKELNPVQSFIKLIVTAEFGKESAHEHLTNPVARLENNIRIIQSRCPDASKYMSYNEEDANYNKLMDALLKREVGTQRKSKFGQKIKI